MADAPDYSVPALEKALDILELLADEAGGLSQSEIADAIGRSVGQIFRVLTNLERRGYLVRDPQSALYQLSTRLFDLAHRHPPLRGLVSAATTPMRELAETVRQSCNLSVVDAGRVRIIAQVESPADFGYRVRVGATFPMLRTATGIVLAAGAAPDLGLDGDFEQADLESVRRDGYLVRADALQQSITDLVVPIRDAAGGTIAALTVPYVATTFSDVASGEVLREALATATVISLALIGKHPDGAR
ncbi:MAG: hypothetical protein QOI02_213 [Actinomycetota bacterium]|jgi:DNA-binding IclR family transcriptional regulator|nr:hypothetical protein [Actinomycetota bacterium]